MKYLRIIILILLVSPQAIGSNYYSNHWRPIEKNFDSIANLLEKGFIYDDNRQRRDTLILCLYKMAEIHLDNPVYHWRSLFWDTRNKLRKGQSKEAKQLIEEAFQKVDSSGYKYDYIRILHLKTALSPNEKAIQAYQNLKIASDYYRKINDMFMLAHAYIDIGNILNNVKDYSKALEYLQLADNYYKQLHEHTYQAKNQLNISNVLYLMNHKKEAEDILHQLLSNPVCTKDTAFYVSVLLSLSEYDITRHKTHIQQARDLAHNFKSQGLIFQTEAAIGQYYQKIQQTDSALYHYHNALHICHNRPKLLMPIVRNMATCFAQEQHTDSAYLYLLKHQQWKDSLETNNNLAEIRLMENKIAIEKHKLEMQQAEERARFRFLLTTITSGFIVCIALLISYIFWAKRREINTQKQLEEIKNRELALQLKEEKYQKEQAEDKLASKNRELTFNSLMIIAKNQMMKTIMDELEKKKNAGEIPSNTVTQIERDIKQHLNKDNEWEFFRKQFVTVHPQFFTRLKANCASITEGELKLCAYIRMGMETKQIAQILGVQPESIKKNRYRLRQHLNLADDSSLEDYIRNI